MLAVPFATGRYRHISFPSDARTPTPACAVILITVRTPCTSATTGDAYPSSPLRSMLVHTVLPLLLSRPTIAAFGPPGVTIKLIASTSLDSLSNHALLRPP